jgi:multidrug efflux pump subunit AcrA (membrane-fusion protein)
LFTKGYVTELQLEADSFAVEKAKKDVETARTKLKVLEAFTKVKMLKQLESDILTFNAQWEAEKSSHELESNKLKDIEDQIAKCMITAPNEGQVTYGHKRDRRGDTDVIIEEGAIVRERQPIIRLPDMSRMQVKIEVNESVIDLVRVGMRASIRSVGRDDVTLPGTVTQVNEYSEPTSYWQGNIKNYAAYVRVDRTSELLRVGMTAEVTIHCETIPDVLQVPVQAVYAHGPQLDYCFVRTSNGWEPRQVKLGPTNDRYVVIQQGLQEKEIVSLNPRRYLDGADLPKLAADEQQQVVKNTPHFDEAQDTTRQGRSAADSDALANQLMQRLDANSDGVLSADELPAIMQANLKAADTNGDGSVDAGELAAAAGRLARVGLRGPGGEASGGGE